MITGPQFTRSSYFRSRNIYGEWKSYTSKKRSAFNRFINAARLSFILITVASYCSYNKTREHETSSRCVQRNIKKIRSQSMCYRHLSAVSETTSIFPPGVCVRVEADEGFYKPSPSLFNITWRHKMSTLLCLSDWNVMRNTRLTVMGMYWMGPLVTKCGCVCKRKIFTACTTVIRLLLLLLLLLLLIFVFRGVTFVLSGVCVYFIRDC
jgi:hypothetical protein